MSSHALGLRGPADPALLERLAALRTELELPPAFPAPVLAEAEAAAREVHAGLTGHIPADYVPEATLRLSLYRRLARMAEVSEVVEFEDELADRFGPLPPAVAPLLALTRLRLLCARAGVARLDSGPQAAALTPRDPADARRLAGALGGRVREGRVIVGVSGPRAQARVEQLAALLGG